MAAATMASVAAVMQNIKLPIPPSLVGPLLPNQWLAKAARHAHNRIVGPASMVVVNKYVYAGLQSGHVVEIVPDGRLRVILRMSTKECGTVSNSEQVCGRPLGVRADANQFLVVADAYKGIFRINPRNGRFRQLVDGKMVVNGSPLGYINDLAITRDGTIFFTSSSSKFNRTRGLDIMLAGDNSGRVLVYNPRESPPNHVRELVANLYYPSGITLSPDESYLLVGESARAKIYRAWIGPNTPRRGHIETFAENLPGSVAHIRLSPRGTYWVAFYDTRSKDEPSLLDQYGSQPDKRRELMGKSESEAKTQTPKKSMVIELDDNGDIIRSLHDPTGHRFRGVTEVREESGILFFGSMDRGFVGTLKVSLLPDPIPSSKGGGLFGGGAGGPTDTNPFAEIPSSGGGEEGPQGEALRHFLSQVRTNTNTLSGSQLQEIVILLVRRLIEAVAEIRRVLAQAGELRKDLRNLQGRLPNASSSAFTTAPPTPTTTQYQFNFPTSTVNWGFGSTAPDNFWTTAPQQPTTTTATATGTTSASSTTGASQTTTGSGGSTTPVG